MNTILRLINRTEELFTEDIEMYESEIAELVKNSSFLVIGGAGSIGQAVVKELFKRKARVLHVVDLSENNLVELVRDIRSSKGYMVEDFRTLPLDCGSLEYDMFIESYGNYDYVMNLSALKHVRSEKDTYTLMRMIDVNILNTEKTLKQSIEKGAKKYFCVSTDKAVNSVNMMGASKRIMEEFLMRRSVDILVSTARFANVTFSDGSLLYGFRQRIAKEQPLSAPRDIKRYFITEEESGELCLMSCLFGENMDLFFPKLNERLHFTTFSEIAVKYLESIGYTPYLCSTEDEARNRAKGLIEEKKWPCYFFDSDTTGEKDFEEFYTENEVLDMNRFKSIGIIKNTATFEDEDEKLQYFEQTIAGMKEKKRWTKEELVDLFNYMLPEFRHKETHKYLDQRM
ncbi:MAG: UDP-N-acetylglucosamine 4,6-dehydratase [bacterium]|nr:UDP-N-acetylglucosamine 4,6-dehydratase [bacterium]